MCKISALCVFTSVDINLHENFSSGVQTTAHASSRNTLILETMLSFTSASVQRMHYITPATPLPISFSYSGFKM